MGHSNSNPLSKHKEILKDYNLQESNEDRSYTYLTHKYTKQKYILREYSLHETLIYEKIMQELRNRLGYNDKAITKLIKFQGEQVENVCSKFFKIYSLWQYSSISLAKQINRRSKNRVYFSFEEILAVLMGIVKGLSLFYSKSVKYQSLTSQSILIDRDCIKIIDPILTMSVKNSQKIKQNKNIKGVYISPQQCQNFYQGRVEYYQSQNSTVFVAGMVVLQAALLEYMNRNYQEQYKKVNWKEIGDCLRKFQSMHGRQLTIIIKSMLQPQSSKRPKFQQLLQRIVSFDKLYKSQELSRVNFSRSLCLQRPQNGLSKTPLSVSTAGLESSRVQKRNNNFQPYFYKDNEVKNTNKTKITMNFQNQKRQKPIFLQQMATINPHTDVNSRSQISTFCHQLHTSRMSPITNESNNNLIFFTERSDAARPNVYISHFDSSSNISQMSQSSLKLRKYEHSSKTVVQKFKNGSQYNGQKVNGVRSGWGKYTFEDGGYYQGQWRDSKMHGNGKLYYKSQKLAYDGNWVQGQFSGKGNLYNQYPRKLEIPFEQWFLDLLSRYKYDNIGQFHRDNKEGKGVLMLTNGQYYEGQFKDNQPHGQGIYYTLKGEKISGVWRHGIL